MRLSSLLQTFAHCILATATALTCTAQPIPTCDPAAPGLGLPGTSGFVGTMTSFDPDGAGPESAKVLFTSNSRVAGTVRTNGIGLYDPVTDTFAPLPGASNTIHPINVNSLALLPSGDLVVGGNFTSIGLEPTAYIARWNGSVWQPLGSGVNKLVNSLAVLPNGDLIAGGDFNTAGGLAVNGVARWDGSQWHPLGTGVSGTFFFSVSAVLTTPTGDVVAAGSFNAAGGVSANNIARWDGANWSPLGAGTGAGVTALALEADGDILAGGSFTAAGGAPANRIARWDGANWSPLGPGLSGGPGVPLVRSIIALPNGDAVVVGAFTHAGETPVNGVARWDGLAWSAFGSGVSPEGNFPFAPFPNCAIALPDDQLLIGGVFNAVGDQPAHFIARWQHGVWSQLGKSINDAVHAFATTPEGDTIVAGNFTKVGGLTVNRIARRTGTAWHPLGTGMNGVVQALAVLPDGNIIAGGRFTSAGGVDASNIARWDGSAWSPLGSGVDGEVRAVAVLPGGDVVVGGSFSSAGGETATGLAKWDGTAWSTWNGGVSGGATPTVGALFVLQNGDLLVGGDFTHAAGVPASDLARFDGAVWTSMNLPSTTGGVHALAALDNGDIVAAGNFFFGPTVSDRFLAKWNGTTWQSLGRVIADGAVGIRSLAVLEGGDLVAAGVLFEIDRVPMEHIGRWDGNAWTSLGFLPPPLFSDEVGVFAVSTLPSGELAIGGDFCDTGSTPASYLDFYNLNGIPSVVQQPSSRSIRAGRVLSLTATPEPGFNAVGVQWYWYNRVLSDRSGFGVNITGASKLLESPTVGIPATITIRNITSFENGIYTAVFTSPCGSISSRPATVTIRPNCSADINGDNVVNTADLLKLLSRFGQSIPIGSEDEAFDVVPDGVVNTFDVTVFMTDFGKICP